MADFEVQGLKELNERLQQLPVKLERNILRGAIRAGAQTIVQAAKQLCPVGDPSGENVRLYGGYRGALRDSIHARGVQSKNGMIIGGVSVGGTSKKGTDTFYARFIEFGTSKMTARPFLRPAIDSKTPAAIDATAAYIRERSDRELLS